MTLTIDGIYGLCPVQGDGTIEECPFYFRARGGSWEFKVYSEEDEQEVIYSKTGPWGEGPYDAGYMPKETAKALIEQCAEEFWDRYTGPDKPRMDL